MILSEAERYRLFLYGLFIVRSTYETIGHSVIIDSEFDLIVFVNKLNLVIISPKRSCELPFYICLFPKCRFRL